MPQYERRLRRPHQRPLQLINAESGHPSPPIEWLSIAIGPLLLSIAWVVTTFVRGLGDMGFGGTNIVVLGFLATLVCVSALQVLIRPGPLRAVPIEGYLLVYVVTVFGAFKVLVSPAPLIDMRFLAETVLITTVPLAVATLSARRGLPGTLALVLAAAGGITALMVLYFVIIHGPIVRRLDVQGALGIGLAQNQLGHGFALSVTAAVFLALRARSGWRSVAWWSLSGLCMAAVVGTGSRSSVVGATAGVGVLLFAAIPRQNVRQGLVLPIGLFVVVGAIAWLVAAGADDLLLTRFTPGVVGSAFGSRTELLASSLRSMMMNGAWWEFAAGMSAIYYMPFRDATVPFSVPDPHNVFVSALVFWGPFAALLLLAAVVSAFSNAVKIGRQGRSLDHWLMMALLLPSLSYSVSSGRLTRAFSIWIVIGVIWGQHYLLRLSTSWRLAHDRQIQASANVEPGTDR